MSDLTWPSTLVPSASEWRLISNTAAFSSPLTGVTSTLGRGGDRWACTLTFGALVGDDRAVMNAFLAKLRGQTNRVVLPDHAFYRRGAQAANILVKGGSQTGSSVACDGASNTLTNAVRAGDFVTIENALYMVTDDVSSNGSGELTLTISPPLRSAPADNATVNLLTPTGKFLLTDSTVGWSNRGRGGPTATRIVSSYTLELVEDIA